MEHMVRKGEGADFWCSDKFLKIFLYVRLSRINNVFFLSIIQDGGSLDQVLKEAKRIPEGILGKVSIAVSVLSLIF